jgi:hypothetical protein
MVEEGREVAVDDGMGVKVIRGVVVGLADAVSVKVAVALLPEVQASNSAATAAIPPSVVAVRSRSLRLSGDPVMIYFLSLPHCQA